MNVSFNSIEKVECVQQIIAGGAVVGLVKTVQDRSFTHHVHLKLGDGINNELFQGFGNTPQEAIVDAFVRGQDHIKHMAYELDELKRLME